MITDLTIDNFRGVKTGELTRLRPLTVLLGPNNSAKSTILEGVYLAAASNMQNASVLGEVAGRRGWFGVDGLDYLFWDRDKPASITITTDEAVGNQFTVVFSLDPDVLTGRVDVAKNRGLEEPIVALRFSRRRGDEAAVDATLIVDRSGAVVPLRATGDSGKPGDAKASVRLCDVRSLDLHGQMEDLYSEAEREGSLTAIIELLQAVYPGITDLRIVSTRVGKKFILNVREGGRSVPVYLMGDGFKRAFQLAAEISLTKGGLTLLEEPECFQHPKALKKVAGLILSAIGETQIMLSTHSLELVDMLLGRESLLSQILIYRTVLQDGELISVRIPGEQAWEMRSELEEDPR